MAIQEGTLAFTKDQQNPMGFKTVSSNEVLSHIRGLMDANKVLLFQEILPGSEVDHYPVTTSSGKNIERFWTKNDYRFTFVNSEEPKEREILAFHGFGVSEDSKAVGMSATYAEKYFLIKQFHVPNADDSGLDPDNHGPVTSETPNRPPYSSSEPRSQANPSADPKTDEKALEASAELHAWLMDMANQDVDKYAEMLIGYTKFGTFPGCSTMEQLLRPNKAGEIKAFWFNYNKIKKDYNLWLQSN